MTPAEINLLADRVAEIIVAKLTAAQSPVAVAPERWLTISEAAKVLGVSQPTVERLTRSGLIPSHKLGRCRRYLASELQGHGNSQERPDRPHAEPAAESACPVAAGKIANGWKFITQK
jgi:excisionase family DNA binding protein